MSVIWTNAERLRFLKEFDRLMSLRRDLVTVRRAMIALAQDHKLSTHRRRAVDDIDVVYEWDVYRRLHKVNSDKKIAAKSGAGTALEGWLRIRDGAIRDCHYDAAIAAQREVERLSG